MLPRAALVFSASALRLACSRRKQSSVRYSVSSRPFNCGAHNGGEGANIIGCSAGRFRPFVRPWADRGHQAVEQANGSRDMPACFAVPTRFNNADPQTPSPCSWRVGAAMKGHTAP